MPSRGRLRPGRSGLGRAGTGPRQGPESGQSLAESYRSCALKAVYQTLAMLRPEQRCSFWQDKILPDAALMPIRNDAKFKRLQDEYGYRR